MKRVKLTVVAGVMMLSLTACGGGSSATRATSEGPADTPSQTTSHSTSRSSAPTPEDQAKLLRTNVQAYSNGYLTDEPVAAYNLLSNRCKQRMSLSEFTDLSMAANQMYGSPLPIKTFKANIEGNLARVTYTYSVRAINQTQEPWVKEHGEWREDDC